MERHCFDRVQVRVVLPQLIVVRVDLCDHGILMWLGLRSADGGASAAYWKEDLGDVCAPLSLSWVDVFLCWRGAVSRGVTRLSATIAFL